MLININKLKAVAVSLAFIISMPFSFAYAEDLELPGFSGTINTTVSTGFSVRASERDCALQDGISYSQTAADLSGTGQGALAGRKAANPLLTDELLLSGGSKNYQFSNTCAQNRTDGYGNTSTNKIEYGNVNSDDGNLNYDNGDFIDATTKASVKIGGYTDSGLGVNLSFIGSYNPVNQLNSAGFKPLNAQALDTLESDLTLLDAYVTQSFDTGGAFGYVDVTAGRFVTSWGEATFIPVGINGLVTNALDLTKLRAPGASIRDALVPTEQLSLAFSAGDVGFEIYTQFSSSQVELDPAGSFFGNEVTGDGGSLILANGAYKNENGDLGGCGYMATVVAGLACTAETQAVVRANPGAHTSAGLAQAGFRAADADQWTAWTTAGAAQGHGQTFQSRLTGDAAVFHPDNGGPGFTQVANTMAAFTTDSSDADKMADLVTLWNTTLRATTNDQKATVEIKAADQKYINARDDGEFGIRANTYLDNIGTGVDLGFYYANYHSKVPYVQYKGMGGLYAGDIVGAYATQVGDALGSGDGNPGYDASDAANVNIFNSGQVGTYGSGICGGLGALLGHANFTDGMDAEYSKQVYQNLIHKRLVNGEMVHNAASCRANDGPSAVEGNPYDSATVGLLMTLTPALAGAVLPLNYAQYQFIYPEDIEVFGASFNTNLGPTTVQGEIAYRPDMPLATSSGDQVNQIGDASGVTLALTAFGHDTYALAPANVPFGVMVPNHINTLFGAGLLSQDFATLLKNAKRSSLPTIASSRTDTVGTDYHSDAFIRYDVISADIGTTTSFSASHPITQGLGADGAVLLTELAMVSISSLDNVANGFVARGGFNEGSGEHLCLGIYNGLTGAELAALNGSIATNLAAAGVTSQIDHNFDGAEGASNVGASIVDAIFGNGSYCESQMGADSKSFSYRVVGSATYNNVNNTAWSLSPSFVWAHDPSGYGPSSLGGFTEGKQSLSLGLTARKGEGLSTSLNYVNQMGDRLSNSRADMDYLSASVTYAF
jgi:hypothetical protein